MPSELHERLIWEATKRGWRTEPWKAAITDRLRLGPWYEGGGEYVLESLRECPLLPDAWRTQVRKDPGCTPTLWVEFLEVIVTGYPSEKKKCWYADLWSLFDATDLLEFNVFGMHSDGELREWDLNGIYRRVLRAEIEEERQEAEWVRS